VKVPEGKVQDFFSRWNRGEFESQRVGQAFLNHFSLTCDHESHPGTPCLFYEEDGGVAAKRIWEEHVSVS